MLMQEVVTTTDQRIIVMLDPTRDDVLKPMYCLCCGSIVLEYYGSVKMVLPGEVEIEWIDVVGRPNTIYCKNRIRRRRADGSEVRGKCKARYNIIG